MADNETSSEVKPADLEVVQVTNPGFIDRVTPKDPKDLHLLSCTKVLPTTNQNPGEIERRKCGGIHFRHAGYIHNMIPFMRADQKKVELAQHQVLVCVKCRTCYVWAYDQLYDVTDRIDLKAWEVAEKELHKATGPGGQC